MLVRVDEVYAPKFAVAELRVAGGGKVALENFGQPPFTIVANLTQLAPRHASPRRTWRDPRASATASGSGATNDGGAAASSASGAASSSSASGAAAAAAFDPSVDNNYYFAAIRTAG